ncbi:hypothetical protein C8J57DRAFT_1255317 [Mycena rebaudengoi]|nr:hypothetical protein C8J57DRAFT_1255317 [Mycena rebaudengoi]
MAAAGLLDLLAGPQASDDIMYTREHNILGGQLFTYKQPYREEDNTGSEDVRGRLPLYRPSMVGRIKSVHLTPWGGTSATVIVLGCPPNANTETFAFFSSQASQLRTIIAHDARTLVIVDPGYCSSSQNPSDTVMIMGDATTTEASFFPGLDVRLAVMLSIMEFEVRQDDRKHDRHHDPPRNIAMEEMQMKPPRLPYCGAFIGKVVRIDDVYVENQLFFEDHGHSVRKLTLAAPPQQDDHSAFFVYQLQKLHEIVSIDLDNEPGVVAIDWFGQRDVFGQETISIYQGPKAVARYHRKATRDRSHNQGYSLFTFKSTSMADVDGTSMRRGGLNRYAASFFGVLDMYVAQTTEQLVFVRLSNPLHRSCVVQRLFFRQVEQLRLVLQQDRLDFGGDTDTTWFTHKNIIDKGDSFWVSSLTYRTMESEFEEQITLYEQYNDDYHRLLSDLEAENGRLLSVIGGLERADKATMDGNLQRVGGIGSRYSRVAYWKHSLTQHMENSLGYSTTIVCRQPVPHVDRSRPDV